MAAMTGAQALVRSLAMEGVEAVFAVPGVQIMDVFDALESEPGIRLVTVRHEQATAYMGDGYARATGKVGVALVVPGPGALNVAAGLGTAYATSSPVLLISGQVESYNLGKDRGVARGKRPAGYLPPPHQMVRPGDAGGRDSGRRPSGHGLPAHR